MTEVLSEEQLNRLNQILDEKFNSFKVYAQKDIEKTVVNQCKDLIAQAVVEMQFKNLEIIKETDKLTINTKDLKLAIVQLRA